jgi:CBS domain-containing membrane protein
MSKTESQHVPAIQTTERRRPAMVKDIMTEIVETLQIGDTLDLAAQLMRAGHIRHLPVVDDEEHLVGLLTHRRILSAWVSHGDPNHEHLEQVARDVPVETLMEQNVLTVSPDTTAALAAAILESSKFGCLPVLESGKVVGILTEADFVSFARRYFEAESELLKEGSPVPTGASRLRAAAR